MWKQWKKLNNQRLSHLPVKGLSRLPVIPITFYLYLHSFFLSDFPVVSVFIGKFFTAIYIFQDSLGAFCRKSPANVSIFFLLKGLEWLHIYNYYLLTFMSGESDNIKIDSIKRRNINWKHSINLTWQHLGAVLRYLACTTGGGQRLTW